MKMNYQLIKTYLFPQNRSEIRKSTIKMFPEITEESESSDLPNGKPFNSVSENNIRNNYHRLIQRRRTINVISRVSLFIVLKLNIAKKLDYLFFS